MLATSGRGDSPPSAGGRSPGPLPPFTPRRRPRTAAVGELKVPDLPDGHLVHDEDATGLAPDSRIRVGVRTSTRRRTEPPYNWEQGQETEAREGDPASGWVGDPHGPRPRGNTGTGTGRGTGTTRGAMSLRALFPLRKTGSGWGSRRTRKRERRTGWVGEAPLPGRAGGRNLQSAIRNLQSVIRNPQPPTGRGIRHLASGIWYPVRRGASLDRKRRQSLI